MTPGIGEKPISFHYESHDGKNKEKIRLGKQNVRITRSPESSDTGSFPKPKVTLDCRGMVFSGADVSFSTDTTTSRISYNSQPAYTQTRGVSLPQSGARMRTSPDTFSTSTTSSSSSMKTSDVAGEILSTSSSVSSIIVPKITSSTSIFSYKPLSIEIANDETLGRTMKMEISPECDPDLVCDKYEGGKVCISYHGFKHMIDIYVGVWKFRGNSQTNEILVISPDGKKKIYKPLL